MRERPALTDSQIAAALREGYGLSTDRVTFLPVGNDSGAWSYRIDAGDGRTYFLKVRRGEPDAPGLVVPCYLREQGMIEVVAALPAASGALWQPANGFGLILYPYIEGRCGMDVELSEAQWVRLGATLRAVHGTRLPDVVAARVPEERFILPWSGVVREVNAQVAQREYEGASERKLASFWRARSDEIARIVDRAEELGRMMQARGLERVLCHADIHTANVLVNDRDGLSIVDWDGVVFAPKERDLMFVVNDIARGAEARSRQQALFFEGYGEVELDRPALAYYRYEWVVQEIGDYAERVFLTDDLRVETKADAVRGLMALFDPGDVVDGAYASEWA